MPRFTSKMTKHLIAPIGLCLAAAGCTNIPGYVDYGDHSDKISLHGGDAVAYNRVVQTENPWPSYVNRTHIHMDGEVADLAMDRYKSDNKKEPKGFGTTGGVSGGDAGE